MEQITTVVIDLAKSVLLLHGVDGAGRVLLRKAVRRDQLVATVAGISPCLIGMEACSGARTPFQLNPFTTAPRLTLIGNGGPP